MALSRLVYGSDVRIKFRAAPLNLRDLCPEFFAGVPEPGPTIGVCVEALKVEARQVRGIPRRFPDCTPRAFSSRSAACFGRCLIPPFSSAFGAIHGNR